MEKDLELTTDTEASIYTSGMLGDRYISLATGGEPENLKDGDQIGTTHPGMILEQVMGAVLYGLQKDNKKDDPSGKDLGLVMPGSTTQKKQ